MRRHAIKEDENGKRYPTEYQLACIIHQIGRALHSGHYITDVLNLAQPGRSRRYNDAVVTGITSKQALGSESQKNAYLLFYINKTIIPPAQRHSKQPQIDESLLNE